MTLVSTLSIVRLETAVANSHVMVRRVVLASSVPLPRSSWQHSDHFSLQPHISPSDAQMKIYRKNIFRPNGIAISHAGQKRCTCKFCSTTTIFLAVLWSFQLATTLIAVRCSDEDISEKQFSPQLWLAVSHAGQKRCTCKFCSTTTIFLAALWPFQLAATLIAVRYSNENISEKHFPPQLGLAISHAGQERCTCKFCSTTMISLAVLWPFQLATTLIVFRCSDEEISEKHFPPQLGLTILHEGQERCTCKCCSTTTIFLAVLWPFQLATILIAVRYSDEDVSEKHFPPQLGLAISHVGGAGPGIIKSWRSCRIGTPQHGYRRCKTLISTHIHSNTKIQFVLGTVEMLSFHQ
jgi:predicted secreted protein